ncbi:MAG: aminopeptidase P family protein [Bergeyella sp.]|nr:aminopeptidase P family protein [Bergeyella sp.]
MREEKNQNTDPYGFTLDRLSVPEKLEKLREVMSVNGVDAFVVYTADPHLSEYLPEKWREREWISGFTGSAGKVVISMDKAALWTDGRYFLQASKELLGSGIVLMKEGVGDTPGYLNWIANQIKPNGRVAVNTLAVSYADYAALENELKKNNIDVIDFPLLDQIWISRPEVPKNPIFVHPVKKAGKSVEEKLRVLREIMKRKEISAYVVSGLDEVAWLLNLRGKDVEANPVFLGYAIVWESHVVLFVEGSKLTYEAKEQMQKAGVEIRPYDEFYLYLKGISGENPLISYNTNQSIYNHLKNHNEVEIGNSPISLLKSQKNKTEIEGFRSAMLKDGVAMVSFLYWLKTKVGREEISEYSIREKLLFFRSGQEDFVGESFSSIVGYKENGAIIHYKANKTGSKEVKAEGTLLVDSGGQYLEGTTDITRTLALGNDVSTEFKRNYTLVLKGLISLSRAVFPKGTCGVQLDVLARLPLWREYKDYAHGTGHGVGSFLNVHEGPQNIRKDLNPQELLPGMVCSNEPGFYLDNRYGIRLENLMVVVPAEKSSFGDFYAFETLTLCPFSRDCIVKELLLEEEVRWLNDYHALCRKKLLSYLEGTVRAWFLNETEVI